MVGSHSPFSVPHCWLDARADGEGASLVAFVFYDINQMDRMGGGRGRRMEGGRLGRRESGQQRSGRHGRREGGAG